MSKNTADDTKQISTIFLKKHGYFCGFKSGTITWTRSGMWGKHKSSVGIEVSTTGDDKYLRIYYTQTDRYTNEKKDFDYKIPLTTTPCRYGGVRYWFICPCCKDGVYCGRRVGHLYKEGDYFACRHCHNLTYESRNQSGIYRGFVSEPDVEDAWKAVKRTHYRGKPTRKYRCYMRLNERYEKGWIEMMRILDKHSFRFINKDK
jgi:hypothetical protein